MGFNNLNDKVTKINQSNRWIDRLIKIICDNEVRSKN